MLRRLGGVRTMGLFWIASWKPLMAWMNGLAVGSYSAATILWTAGLVCGVRAACTVGATNAEPATMPASMAQEVARKARAPLT
jgi:hypothetical protein